MRQVACGAEHSVAVTEDGSVLSWGAGMYTLLLFSRSWYPQLYRSDIGLEGGRGRLGHGAAAVPLDRDEQAPRLLNSLGHVQVTYVAAGMVHSGRAVYAIFLTHGSFCSQMLNRMHATGCVNSEGGVYIWGCNQFCQLGIRSGSQLSSPQQAYVLLTGSLKMKALEHR